MPSSSSPTYTTINLEMILLFTQGVGPSDFFLKLTKKFFSMTFFSSESSFLLLLFQISFNFLRHSGKKQHLKDQTNS